MSDYLEIHAKLPEDAEEQLADGLSASGILGVQVIPGPSGRIGVSVWVPSGDEETLNRVRSVLAALDSDVLWMSERPDEDWSAEWRRSLAAFAVGGRWWIDPRSGSGPDAPVDRVRLRVEPRAAFGSGTHESTQLVLMELESLECRGGRVLDIGTGSGVLAIAADHLGAFSVVGVDTDIIAAWEARTTVRTQSWDCRAQVVAGGLDCLDGAVFDLVLCNMIITEFGPILDDIRRSLAGDGTAVFSGILDCELSAVEAMLEAHEMVVVGHREMGSWISVRAVRSESIS